MGRQAKTDRIDFVLSTIAKTGYVRPRDVATRFGISNVTAGVWFWHQAKDGWLRRTQFGRYVLAPELSK